jgi:hypothetical protein
MPNRHAHGSKGVSTPFSSEGKEIHIHRVSILQWEMEYMGLKVYDGFHPKMGFCCCMALSEHWTIITREQWPTDDQTSKHARSSFQLFPPPLPKLLMLTSAPQSSLGCP